LVPASLKRGWCVFKVWYFSTWFGHLFGVCALRTPKRAIALHVAAGCGYFAFSLWVEFQNPILPPEALERHEGELLEVVYSHSSRNRAMIRIRADGGEELAFRGTMSDPDGLYEAMGRRVVVLSQPYWDAMPPYFHYQRFRKVLEGERVLEEYDEEIYQRMLRLRPAWKIVEAISLAISLLSLFYLVRVCFRETFLERRRGAGSGGGVMDEQGGEGG